MEKITRYATPTAGRACPFAEGRVRAKPGVEEAAEAMWRLAWDPDFGRHIGAAANRYIRPHFSRRAIGPLRICELLPESAE